MRFPTRFAGLIALAAVLPGCATDGTGGSGFASNHPNGTGPFDRNGNYIEDWADNPTKWTRPTSTPVDLPPSDIIPEEPPVIAQHELPPMHAIPIVVSHSSSTTIAATRPPAVKPAVAAAKPAAPAAKPAPKPTQTVSKPKPKPKPKPAAKPKPKTVRYTIRSGDSLARIASRHGTTVAALQKANNIRGSLIHPGKVLVIPK
jgi:LysM repeat protein